MGGWVGRGLLGFCANEPCNFDNYLPKLRIPTKMVTNANSFLQFSGTINKCFYMYVYPCFLFFLWERDLSMNWWKCRWIETCICLLRIFSWIIIVKSLLHIFIINILFTSCFRIIFIVLKIWYPIIEYTSDLIILYCWSL